ncbi:rRNA maturation RNase YbeY [Rhodomicrobium sp. Az07]|uniref:rRNA maturation RNase YbeY n=1 Tax=Rhodomicrobium sp. Az07 TaxID=2839034 RepID=UPI001BE63A54|nr:rRNA maturation RNase YbeY [Rhodomicrobium sp. Az07]MBT3071702.1 rRNA maturation RNase YbeY [Rhodomicrobium sp. Az07]
MTPPLTDATTNAPSDPGPSAEGEPYRIGTDISIEDDRWVSVAGLEELIPKLVAETLREAGFAPDDTCVSVALMSGEQVRSLNKMFRGKDADTNVLSFPSGEAVRAARFDDEPAFLGDVALSYDAVVGEAQAQAKTPLDHSAHLVAHGVLHLVGFDHEADADADAMEAAERVVLARFGIPDPYRDDASASVQTL